MARGQRMPWAELGICLNNLTERQSQHPELLAENLLCAELQVGCFSCIISMTPTVTSL